jgi:hypothetical protein
MGKNPPERRLEVYVSKDKIELVEQAKKLKPKGRPFSAIILDGLELWIRLVGMSKMGDLLEKASTLSGQSYSDTLKAALTNYYKELGGNDALKRMVRQRG